MSTELTQRIVTALVAEGLLEESRTDAAHRTVHDVLAHGAPAPGSAGLPRLVEVVAYLGGALVLAAGWLFVLQQWNDLGDSARTAALALVAVVLGVAGLATVRGGPVGESPARRRLGGTLLAGASLVAGVAAAHGVDTVAEVGFEGIPWPAVLGGLVAAVAAALVHPLARTAVGLVVMLGGAATATAALVADAPGDEALWLGGTMFVVAVGWLAATEAGAFIQLSVARALGVALALFGAQFAVLATDAAWTGYLLTSVLVVAGVLLYLSRLDWPYLAGAVLGVTLLVPEVVTDWTDDSIGTVGGVLVAGITLLVASLAGYRLREEAGE